MSNEDVKPSGGEVVAQALYDLGVTHIFGMDSPEPLYAAIDSERIRLITVHDERAGAAMADAYARVSGRPGVCSAIRGPGVTNLLSGLAEAYNTSTPVVVLVGDIATAAIERNVTQAIDHLALTKQVTKWSIRLDRPERVGELTERAFRHAVSGRPGPVLISLADSALADRGARPVEVNEPAVLPGPRTAGDPRRMAEAAIRLAAARRPVLVAGGGVHISAAYEQLRALAEELRSPVATTPLGKGAFDESHELSAGVVGSYTAGVAARGSIANDLVRRADLVVFIGTKTDSIATNDWTVPSPSVASLHLDVDPAEIGRNYSSYGVVGDAALLLAQLLDAVRACKPAAGVQAAREASIGELREAVEDWRRRIEAARTSDAAPLVAERVLAELDAVLTDRDIVATDASYSSAWGMDLLQFTTPGRRFIGPRGFAGLGWAVPAAIGAKLSSPDSTVYALTGDGGLGYVVMELETAARYQVPVVVVVLNNGILGFQQHFETTKFGRSFETTFTRVNWARLAETLNCQGIRVERSEELGPALKQAAASGVPTLIDVAVSPDSKPPLALFEAAGSQRELTH